jgi:DedD protein
LETRLKHRLIGVSVVVVLTVIFLPELLRPAAERRSREVQMEIPEPPVHTFKPLEPLPAAEPPVESSRPISTAFSDSQSSPTDSREEESVAALATEEPRTPPTTPLPAEQSDTQSSTPPPELQSWVVQVGSFANEPNALSLRDRLRESGFTTFMEPAQVNGRTLYRVRVGPELERAEAERIKAKLDTEFKLNGQLTRYP